MLRPFKKCNQTGIINIKVQNLHRLFSETFSEIVSALFSKVFSEIFSCPPAITTSSFVVSNSPVAQTALIFLTINAISFSERLSENVRTCFEVSEALGQPSSLQQKVYIGPISTPTDLNFNSNSCERELLITK